MSDEDYKGVKFKLLQIDKDVPQHQQLNKLKHYCAEFDRMGYAPKFNDGSSGNLSFRITKGSDAFIITCAHTALQENMPDEDFAAVHNIALEANEVEAISVKPPSSESLMHGALYRARPEVNAIFHGHAEIFFNKNHPGDAIPETETEQEYGTPQLVCEILRIPDNPNFLILKNHGFVAMGKSMEDTAQLIENIKNSLNKN